MDIQNLVKMANNIGFFFKSEPDHTLAVASVEQHLKNFWDPRMRVEIINYAQQGGMELIDIVDEAVHKLAQQK
ncbi:formate dehydrogenase [Methyloprofundus sedimenti]|uniref:Formate dehydrogenase n=1 Tax=Methyloprofundus sedimenti TaxID=1420851 RepID=A0A1V8M8C9_9GAMM|nr:formate dehydrogenase subunit delta [Methyloprofundus sedimenti]OQK17840.1 formate dehydrogenase [Methyloprofundus sedimenti]